MVSRLSSMAPAPLFPTHTPLNHAPYVDSTKHLMQICMDMLDQPLELDCGNVVYLPCATRWLTIFGSIDCPCCTSPLTNHAYPPSRVILDMLGNHVAMAGQSRALCCPHQVPVPVLFQHSVHSSSRMMCWRRKRNPL